MARRVVKKPSRLVFDSSGFPNRICGIYCIRNTTNGYYYYGQSIDIRKRIIAHRFCLSHNRSGNPKLQHAWDAHPEHVFVATVVCLVSVEHLDAAEQQLLATHVGRRACYNTAIDAAACARGRPCTDATKLKISVANRGKGNFYYGKRGRQHPRFGVRWSKDTRIKMMQINRVYRSKPVIQIDPETLIPVVVFESIAEAARATGAKFQNISLCCRNSDKPFTARGFFWRYQQDRRPTYE